MSARTGATIEPVGLSNNTYSGSLLCEEENTRTLDRLVCLKNMKRGCYSMTGQHPS